MKKVAVVIPYYHSQLNELEQISFRQCLKVLYRYPILLVVPDSMEKSEYPAGHEFIIVKVPSQWMQSVSTYNRMMLEIDFYARFTDYEYILIYQLDAFVFRDELSRFCEMGYDYIGAPWPRGNQYIKNVRKCMWYVGNGGLSLRNVEASIVMLKKYPAITWDREEDVYWATCDSAEFHVAPIETAVSFSIEQLVRRMVERNHNQLPFGCHAWEKHDFSFWRPFFEAEGYQFPEEMTGETDRQLEKMSLNMLEIPSEIIRKSLAVLTHREIKQVYVWGAGKIGKRFLLLLGHAGFMVRSIDADSLLWGKYLWDVCIESPNILKSAEKKSLIVIAVKNYIEEIMEQLCQMGFCHGQEVFVYEEVQEAVLKEYNDKQLLVWSDSVLYSGMER